MKHTTSLLLFVFLFSAVPATSHALSCIDPWGMIDAYATESSFTVFTATPGQTVEHTKEKATEPFMQDSGYTGQFVTVSAVHKGTMLNEAWVYYQKDSTWGYLCTNQPPEEGVESVYILRNNNGAFDLPQVVNVFATDSEIAKELLGKLETDDEEGFLNELSDLTIKERVASSLREIIFIARIKLAEWRFWSN